MEKLRLILFLGLVFHKFLWEVLKRRYPRPELRQGIRKKPLKRIIKTAKVVVLICLLIQTLFLDVFPITNPATFLRPLGTAIYFFGLALAVTGRLQIGRNWVDLEDYQLFPDQTLVTTGIYRYIRHAIYAGDLLLIAGLELALQSWLVFGTVLLIPFLLRQANAEEALLARAFPEYDAYRARTKRFIPFIL